MNIKTLKIFFLLVTTCMSTSASGQIKVYGPPTLTSLVNNAKTIYRANHINEQNGNYNFSVKDISSDKYNLDTFKIICLPPPEIITNKEKYQNNEQNDIQIRGTRINLNKKHILNFQEAEEFILFNSLDSNYHYCFVLKAGKIYRQGYFEEMSVEFDGINTEMRWEELIENILSIKSRFEKVNHIKNIENVEDRNNMLFNWIDNNKLTFIDTCYQQGIYIDCGWEHIDSYVFRWITEGGIAKDTWNASKLFREIKFPNEVEWVGFTGLLSDYNGNSFKSYNDIDFLISTAISDSSTMIDKRQALNYLRLASKKVFENNYPIPETKILTEQKNKQKSIRDKILPLLENQNLKRSAFQVIRNMSNPMDGIIEHRIDLEVLPLVVKYYQNESPSKFKGELADFIVHNSSEEEWKILSNCDKRIFVDLYSVYVDTIQHQLRFGINCNYGRELINELPIVVIKNSLTDEIVYNEQYREFKLPYYSHNGVRYIYINLENFTKGDYTIYTKGKAGKNSQFTWNSEYGEFTIE